MQNKSRITPCPDPEKTGRVMEAMLKMKKLDVDELKRAYAG